MYLHLRRIFLKPLVQIETQGSVEKSFKRALTRFNVRRPHHLKFYGLILSEIRVGVTMFKLRNKIVFPF